MKNGFHWFDIIERLQRVIFWVLPFAALGLLAINWFRYGVDVPFYDDWRALQAGIANDFNLGYFFTPVNHTISPVGLALNVMAQRLLNGNGIYYQLLSMLGVLGSILLLQAALIRHCIKDHLLAAVAFCMTVGMIQPDIYWGRDNLAYHQVLPLPFLLLSIYVIFISKWRLPIRLLVLFSCACLAGFSYVSGAFAILCAGLVFFAMAHFYQNQVQIRAFKYCALTLVVGGFLASAVQAWAVADFQKHVIQNMGAQYALVMPWEADFWWFGLGKIARALMLPKTHIWLSFCVSVAVGVMMFAMCLRATVMASSNTARSQSSRQGLMVFVALTVVCFVYLAQISAGRAHASLDNVLVPVDLFRKGFERAHFYWLMMYWPWLIVGVFVLCAWSDHTLSRIQRLLVCMLAWCVIAWFGGHGGFRYAQDLKEVASNSGTLKTCIFKEIHEGHGVDCPGLLFSDASKSIVYAKSIDASFVKRADYAPLDELTLREPVIETELSNERMPAIHFAVKNRASLSACLSLAAVLTGPGLDPGNTRLAMYSGNKEVVSGTQGVPINAANIAQGIVFGLDSINGFSGEGTVEATSHDLALKLDSVHLYCRMRENPLANK